MRDLPIHSVAIAFVLGLTGLGCGSSSTPGSSTAPIVAGLASADSPVSSVGLKDSSSSASLRTTTPDATGRFTFDVAGLSPPFFLKADAESGAVYAIASRGGTANVNPITTAACAGSSAREDAEDGEDGRSGKDSHSSEKIGDVIRELSNVLRPLFDLYGIKRIGEDDEDRNDSHLRALLQDVSFTVKRGVVTVTNRTTGAIIFTGSMRHLSDGTFYPENMPAGPGGTPVLSQACTFVPACTLATAVASCSTCHGSAAAASHSGRALTCANCHGPVNNGSGTPSAGMVATLSGTTCSLTYPTRARTTTAWSIAARPSDPSGTSRHVKRRKGIACLDPGPGCPLRSRTEQLPSWATSVREEGFKMVPAVHETVGTCSSRSSRGAGERNPS